MQLGRSYKYGISKLFYAPTTVKCQHTTFTSFKTVQNHLGAEPGTQAYSA